MTRFSLVQQHRVIGRTSLVNAVTDDLQVSKKTQITARRDCSCNHQEFMELLLLVFSYSLELSLKQYIVMGLGISKALSHCSYSTLFELSSKPQNSYPFENIFIWNDIFENLSLCNKFYPSTSRKVTVEQIVEWQNIKWLFWNNPYLIWSGTTPKRMLCRYCYTAIILCGYLLIVQKKSMFRAKESK